MLVSNVVVARRKGKVDKLQQELLQSVIQLNHDMASRTAGEYNIFSVLGIQGKEVLTCRFLSDLMDPRGQHGQGAAFLRLFLDDVLGMPINSEEELNHAVVTTEYLIDKERRIDIVIELGQRTQGVRHSKIFINFINFLEHINYCLLYLTPQILLAQCAK